MTRHSGAGAAVVLAALALPGAVAFTSCLPSPQRMCTATSDCGGGASSCVAGRCIANGAVPAISTARRVVFEPVDVGFVQRGAADTPGALAPATLATFGRSSGGRIFLRFDVALRPEETLVEAFLAMERVPDVAADPAEIVLHAAHVLDRWDSRRLSWANQPRVEELGLPQTPVLPAAGTRVRLDVRALLELWRRGRPGDVSLAVLSDGESATGIAFALTPGRVRGPELELYVR